MSRTAVLGTVLGLALVLGGLWWLRQGAPPAPAAVPVAATPEAGIVAGEEGADVPPAPEYEAPASGPAASSEPLPALDDSDATVRGAVIAAFGSGISDMLISERLIRRFVITVNSLDGEPVPLRQRPLKHVPGRPVVVRGENEQLSLSADNARRYEGYLRLLEMADMNAVVALYQRHYPLVQKAYLELGESRREFNDRFIHVLDHLLAAPEVAQPVDLIQPKVLYEYADPQLQALSSGHKILVRMGPANAAAVKSKLRALRASLVARSPVRAPGD